MCVYSHAFIHSRNLVCLYLFIRQYLACCKVTHLLHATSACHAQCAAQTGFCYYSHFVVFALLTWFYFLVLLQVLSVCICVYCLICATFHFYSSQECDNIFQFFSIFPNDFGGIKCIKLNIVVLKSKKKNKMYLCMRTSVACCLATKSMLGYIILMHLSRT